MLKLGKFIGRWEIKQNMGNDKESNTNNSGQSSTKIEKRSIHEFDNSKTLSHSAGRTTTTDSVANPPGHKKLDTK